jgi:PAS domain S-box-containing protein
MPQHIINSIPLGVLITNLDGEITHFNPALTEILGYTDLNGKHLADITSEANVQDDENALHALSGGEPPASYIKEFKHAEDNDVPCEVYIGGMRDEDKQLTHAIFVVKALSEEMKLLTTLQRRNMQLLASSEVARASTQILDIQELLTRCVDLIRTHFGFYYAAIFLIDGAGEWAVLRAATGEAGHKLLEVGHKLGVGSQSMVGWVTANNAARIALDVGEEAIRFDNPYLPKTRSEMALPLRVRNEVVGALDVQSTSLHAFSDEDIQTIQMMADQVAIAIDNARLFSEQRNGG